MGKYFPNKTTVYLDQFMTSQLFDKEAAQFWRNLLNLLEEAVAQDKVIVLYSLEHLLESSHRDYERARYHDVEFFKLTRGYTLESEGKTTTKLLLKAIRNYKITPSTFCYTLETARFSDKEIYELLRARKDTYNKMAEEMGNMINPIRAATASTGFFDLKVQRELAIEHGNEYKGELISRFRKLYRHGFSVERTIEFKVKEIPFWADAIINILINEHCLTRKECKRAWELLEKNSLANILPTLYVRTSLESMMATRHKKETHNDHIDILRMTTALPFSDIVFTDQSMASAIKDVNLDRDFKCTVLTGTAKDLEQFGEWLSGVLK